METLRKLIEENNVENPTIVVRDITMQTEFFAIMFGGLNKCNTTDFEQYVNNKIVEKAMAKNKVKVILHECNEQEMKWIGFKTKQQFKNFKTDLKQMFDDFASDCIPKSTKEIFKSLLSIKKIVMQK